LKPLKRRKVKVITDEHRSKIALGMTRYWKTLKLEQKKAAGLVKKRQRAA
jgi:hypothetical protein